MRYQRGEEELQSYNPASSKACVSNAAKRILMEHMSSKCEDGLPGVNMSLQGDSLFERGNCWDLCDQIVPHQLDMEMVLGI